MREQQLVLARDTHMKLHATPFERGQILSMRSFQNLILMIPIERQVA
jgi:hypothetical protein